MKVHRSKAAPYRVKLLLSLGGKLSSVSLGRLLHEGLVESCLWRVHWVGPCEDHSRQRRWVASAKTWSTERCCLEFHLKRNVEKRIRYTLNFKGASSVQEASRSQSGLMQLEDQCGDSFTKIIMAWSRMETKTKWAMTGLWIFVKDRAYMISNWTEREESMTGPRLWPEQWWWPQVMTTEPVWLRRWRASVGGITTLVFMRSLRCLFVFQTEML